MKRSYLYITLLLTAFTLGSCKIGKSYVRPDLNLPDSLAQHQDTLSFGDREWWQIYTDSTLRSLIDRALEHNKDMFRINPDKIGVFCYPNAGISRRIFVDIKRMFLLCG